METNITLLITIIVLVGIIFLFQIEQYRKIMAIFTFYSHESPPPKEVRYDESLTFIDKKYK
jgi:hypothetical protein